MCQGAIRNRAQDRYLRAAWSVWFRRHALLFREVERQQVADILVSGALRQLGEHMMQIRIGLDITGPTRQNEAVDHGTRLRARHRV